jgi:outer membrane translocation and assembly module TamA
LQRTRYLSPFLGYDITQNDEIRTTIKFENTSSVSTDANTVYERGRNVTGTIGLIHNTLKENESLPAGTKLSIDFTRSYDSLGSEFDYTQTELDLTGYSYPFNYNYFKTRIKIGYPVATIKKPLTSLYYVGGYDILRGYGYKEFYGNCMAYIELAYHSPFVLKKSYSTSSLELVTGDIFIESVKIGEKEKFDNTNETKTSFGIGSSCSIQLFKSVNLRFTLSLNQAIEQNRAPVTYLTFNTFSYINTETKKSSDVQ